MGLLLCARGREMLLAPCLPRRKRAQLRISKWYDLRGKATPPCAGCRSLGRCTASPPTCWVAGRHPLWLGHCAVIAKEEDGKLMVYFYKYICIHGGLESAQAGWLPRTSVELLRVMGVSRL